MHMLQSSYSFFLKDSFTEIRMLCAVRSIVFHLAFIGCCTFQWQKITLNTWFHKVTSVSPWVNSRTVIKDVQHIPTLQRSAKSDAKVQSRETQHFNWPSGSLKFSTSTQFPRLREEFLNTLADQRMYALASFQAISRDKERWSGVSIRKRWSRPGHNTSCCLSNRHNQCRQNLIFIQQFS